ncbi:MAG: NAD(P)-binding protein [Elusimicrobiota bacterium]|jgi:protoporphyrinogen oxidase|nr:NAD(P)-binding protein [Elusimicrobiota bacterium]
MKDPIIIIGAGISGLSASYFLKKKNIVLEANLCAGGLCRSFYEDGFTFDCSGHFIHIRDQKIKTFVNKLSGGLEKINRDAAIFLKNNFIPFPFQANLYYLDEKIKKECIDGILKRKDIKIDNKMPFIDWSLSMFGKGITKYFMEPYNKKLWSYDLKKMNAQWTGQFVPKPEAKEIIESAYSKNRSAYGYNSVFYYPKSGGCQALIDGFLQKVKPIMNARTKKIDIKNKIVYTDFYSYKYCKIISTQPIVELIKQISNVPPKVKEAAKKLKFSNVRCVNIGIKSKNGIPAILKNKHWIYMPEPSLPFYRVGIYSNVNKNMSPKNSYSFYIEFSSQNNEYKKSANVINDLKKIGFISKTDEIASINVVDMPYAYVIFDANKDKALKIINEFLNSNNIYSIGRYGAWEYSFIEKNIQDAKAAADIINREK